jgi:hypothetical protein
MFQACRQCSKEVNAHSAFCAFCGAKNPLNPDATQPAVKGSGPSSAAIADQIRRLDSGSKLLGRKEVAELPAILWEGEIVQDIIQGYYNNGLGILVATQRRLIFVDKGLMWGLKVEDFPVDKISSIQYETGLLMGTVTIFTSGNRADIKNVPKDEARRFAETVRARISASAPKAAPSPPTAAPANGDIVSQLERLAALKERGVLTEEEFAAQKSRIFEQA